MKTHDKIYVLKDRQGNLLDWHSVPFDGYTNIEYINAERLQKWLEGKHRDIEEKFKLTGDPLQNGLRLAYEVVLNKIKSL